VALPAGRRLSRRLDNFVLRWHAKLDSDWSDRSLPWILASAAFVVLAALSVARARMLEAGEDLATYAQAAWLVGGGRGSWLTTLGTHLLDVDGSFGFYPIAQLARFGAPLVESLLVAQAAAVAYGVVPLWRLARRTMTLRVGAATALVVAYVLHPAVQNLNLADFHPEVLALPALLAMCHWGLSGSTVRYTAAALVAVAAGAELALVVAAFGVLLTVQGRRRVGPVTTVAGIVWLVGALQVSWLGAGDRSFLFPGAFSAYGDDAASVVGHWLTNPVDTLSRLGAHRNFELAVYLVLPLAFLPLIGLRYLAPGLPWLFLVAMANAPEQARRTYLLIGVLPFVFVAAAHGLHRLGRPSLERISVNPRLVAALLAASIVFFVQLAASSPYASPWSWGGRDITDRARVLAARRVPRTDGVVATARLQVLLAERRLLYRYKPGADPPPEADVVLVDRQDLIDLGKPFPPPTPPGFHQVSDDHGVVVFRRDHPPR
jgi:hypothetical protein